MCSQSQRQFIFRCFRFDDKNSFMKMKQRALRWPKLNVFWVLDFSDNFNYVMYASISIERINKKEYYVFIQTIKWIQKLLQDRWLLTQVLVNSVLAETKFTIKRKQCIDIWPWKKKNKKWGGSENENHLSDPIYFFLLSYYVNFVSKYMYVSSTNDTVNKDIQYDAETGGKKKPRTRHYGNVVPRLFSFFNMVAGRTPKLKLILNNP